KPRGSKSNSAIRPEKQKNKQRAGSNFASVRPNAEPWQHHPPETYLSGLCIRLYPFVPSLRVLRPVPSQSLAYQLGLHVLAVCKHLAGLTLARGIRMAVLYRMSRVWSRLASVRRASQ